MPASPLGSVQTRRAVSSQRTVRTLLVVILPGFDLAPCVAQTSEPVGIQAFISQPTVEAFYVGVLHRLAGLDKLQPHTTFCAALSRWFAAPPNRRSQSVLSPRLRYPASCRLWAGRLGISVREAETGHHDPGKNDGTWLQRLRKPVGPSV
jgi:hypothetical protein